MFESFDASVDTQGARRVALSAGVSLGLYGALVGGLLFAAGRTAMPVLDKEIAVVFHAPPSAEPGPPPAGPPTPRTSRPASRPVTALIEPTRVPDRALAETAPRADEPASQSAGGGDPHGVIGGTGGGGGQAAPVTPTPSIEPAPKPRGPINLPENATAPIADDDNASPEYPEAARASGLEGLVILKIVVADSGEVTKVDVLKGEEPFVAAAIAAVRTWHYSPALVDGRATAVFRIVKVPFRLRG